MGDHKFDVFEVSANPDHQEREILNPEFVHMGIIIYDSTQVDGLADFADQVKGASKDSSAQNMQMVVVITKIDSENSKVRAE